MKPVLIILLLLSSLGAAASPSLQQLQQQGRVSINAWLEPSDNLVVRQQLELVIEVATDRWFAAGTRIPRFELDNAIVLRRKTLATNFTRQQQGQTWSVQRWSISVYPQDSGLYQVEPIAVQIHVAEGQQQISGSLLTPAVEFEVSRPSAFMNDDFAWLVATEFEASQRLSHQGSAILSVGDAIERSVTLSARDTSAMLLPELASFHSDLVQTYSTPPMVQDSQNRGDYFANRTDSQTLIVQDSGTVILPPLTYYWWNPDQQQMHTQVLPGVSYQVRYTPIALLKAYWWQGLLIACALMVSAAAIIKLFRFYQHQPLPSGLALPLALMRGQWSQANLMLYNRHHSNNGQWLLRQQGPEQQQRVEHWSQQHFGKSPHRKTRLIIWRIWLHISAKRIKIKALKRALPQLSRMKF